MNKNLKEGGLFVLSTLLMAYGMNAGITAMHQGDDLGVLIGSGIVVAGVIIGWFVREGVKMSGMLPPIIENVNQHEEIKEDEK